MRTWIIALVCCAWLRATQAQSIESEVCAILDCSLATYILIGIAALYTILSLICLSLIFAACCCCKKRRSKIKPEEVDDDVFGLAPITETTVISNCHTHEGSYPDSKLPPQNESASDSESSEDERDTSLVLKNKTRQHAILKGTHLTSGSSARSSPLLKHRPKSSSVSPENVPVPFSNNDKKVDLSGLTFEQHNGHGPVRLPPIQKKQATPRQIRKAQAAALKGETSSTKETKRSPFPRRRENQQDKVPLDSSKGTPKVQRITKISSSSEIQGSPKPGGALIKEGVLKFEMVKISHKWRSVGTGFTLPSSVLNNISIICSNENDSCMFRVCQEWFKIRKQRDWSELIDVLKMETVNEWKMAAYVRRSYVDKSFETDDLSSQHSEGNLSFYFHQASKLGMPHNGDELEAEGSKVSWID